LGISTTTMPLITSGKSWRRKTIDIGKVL
jgi:hypothetical protein